MSALTDRITEVLLEPLREMNSYCDPVSNEYINVLAAHVAEQIEAELQLTEEHLITGTVVRSDGQYADLRKSRWVSAWSEVKS